MLICYGDGTVALQYNLLDWNIGMNYNIYLVKLGVI